MTVLPVEGKLYGVAIPLNVAWKPVSPVELLKVKLTIMTVQLQFAFALICPLTFLSYIASALADANVDQ